MYIYIYIDNTHIYIYIYIHIYYDKHISSFIHFVSLSFLRHFFLSGYKVLDLGCWPGSWTLYAARSGPGGGEHIVR